MDFLVSQVPKVNTDSLVAKAKTASQDLRVPKVIEDLTAFLAKREMVDYLDLKANLASQDSPDSKAKQANLDTDNLAIPAKRDYLASQENLVEKVFRDLPELMETPDSPESKEKADFRVFPVKVVFRAPKAMLVYQASQATADNRAWTANLVYRVFLAQRVTVDYQGFQANEDWMDIQAKRALAVFQANTDVTVPPVIKVKVVFPGSQALRVKPDFRVNPVSKEFQERRVTLALEDGQAWMGCREFLDQKVKVDFRDRLAFQDKDTPAQRVKVACPASPVAMVFLETKEKQANLDSLVSPDSKANLDHLVSQESRVNRALEEFRDNEDWTDYPDFPV